MTKFTKNVAAMLILTLLSLGPAACKDRDRAAVRDDLPDLNTQTYPYRTVEATRVRTGPGAQFRVVGEIPPNTTVTVVGRDGDWVLVVSKKGNAPGFIEWASVKPADHEVGDTLNPRTEGRYESIADTTVRSGPGLHYPVVAKITRGTKLNVVDEKNGWLKVESRRGNEPGYVEANLAKPARE
jgi:uncharacterized protein YgiM (DUF1202 family)